jgi:hypothetical protein
MMFVQARGLLVLLSSELCRNSPAPAPTAADDAATTTTEMMFVQARGLLHQLAANETLFTQAVVQRAFLGCLACAHIPVRSSN